MKSLIQKLVETAGPSGREDQIRAVIRSEIEPHCQEVRVDALGNLIARKGSKSKEGTRIMISAHMDEIGVIATHVDQNGFVRFTGIGMVYPKYCLGARVRFLNGLRGVINSEHTPDAKEQIPMEKMFIDVGVKDRAACPVKPGDMAVFEGPFIDLGNRIIAKSLDNRLGVAILVELIKTIETTSDEIYFVFTVQEEMRKSGATVATYAIQPDLAVVVDVTATGDTPNGIRMDVALGKGPAIKICDQGMISDRRVVQWMRNTAENTGIEYQLEVLEKGSTDAMAIQLSRAGVPSGVVSIPCRYIHSPSEMVDLQDVQKSFELAQALISKPIRLE